MKKTVFLLSHIPNPRFNKRIKLLSKWSNVHVVCIKRTNMDIFPLSNIEGVKYHITELEIPNSNKIFKRLKATFKTCRYFNNKLREIGPDLIYTSGIDKLIMASKSSKKSKICFEVADLREYAIRRTKFFSLQGITDRIIKYIERQYNNRIDLLVVTSIKFFDHYYSGFISKEKVIEVPNMPELAPFKSYDHKKDGKFTVGFVGGLRYLEQMKMLVDASENLDINIIFSGATNLDYNNSFQNYCKDKNWVTFTGKYDFNKDIANIYSRLDCVYSVYDASNPNVRIALPNKLYEAVICGLPIIVAKNTYLEEIVKKLKIGISVQFDNKDELIDVLNKLKKKDEYYQSLVENCDVNKDKINSNNYLNKLNDRLKLILSQDYV